MTDNKPATDVNISADAALAALSLLGSYVQAGTAVANATGVGASMTAVDQQNKTDVNVPELMTGMNGLAQQMSVNLQASLNAVAVQTANQNQFYNTVLNEMMIDHRDQNHTKQALAVTFPFVIAGDAAEESADDSDK
jgi:hypothetical protein